MTTMTKEERKSMLNYSDIQKILDNLSESLLDHTCKTIPKERLYLHPYIDVYFQ